MVETCRHRVQHLNKLAMFSWFGWDKFEATHNFWILLTRQVTAALMSAGPSVLMTFWCRSCNLVASNEPWGSPTFTSVMWSGIEASSAGSTLDNCSVSCFRGTWNAKHCYVLTQGLSWVINTLSFHVLGSALSVFMVNSCMQRLFDKGTFHCKQILLYRCL
jgi:hypothetical protein